MVMCDSIDFSDTILKNSTKKTTKQLKTNCYIVKHMYLTVKGCTWNYITIY